MTWFLARFTDGHRVELFGDAVFATGEAGCIAALRRTAVISVEVSK